MAGDQKNAMVDRILNSRKYRHLEISRDTVENLIEKEIQKGKSAQQSLKAVREKLHNIVAPYLETLDYPKALVQSDDCVENNDMVCIRDLCRRFLSAHDSTRERLQYFREFFDFLFSKIGPRPAIMDLACGLNPLFLALVPPPSGLRYRAYDLHGARVDLLNTILRTFPFDFQAEKQDILIQPPAQKVDALFLFKEVHRMEKRENGSSRGLIAGLNVNLVFISLPTHSLNGQFDLRERMDRLVSKTIMGLGELEEKITFASERIYVVRKNDG